MVSLIFGVGGADTGQNLSPKPKRVVVPGGGFIPLHRLCVVRFLGCCWKRESLFGLGLFLVRGVRLLCMLVSIALLKFFCLECRGSAVKPNR